MSNKYVQLYDGDGFKVTKDGGVINFACCDCGLVHKFGLAIENDGDIGFALERNNRSTGQLRRFRKYPLLEGKNGTPK
jgi:hypothetical protein